MKQLCYGVFAVGAAAVLSGVASGQTFTLNDGNSSAHFDLGPTAPGSRVGMDSWVVDGVNHMYSQWFWFRTDGMTNEARLNSLPLLAGGTSDSNFNGQDETLFLRFGGAGFTIETRYGLQGGSAGSGTSDVTEQIRITNTSTTTRTFSFFQYCDFDLNGDIVDDVVGLANANAVYQSDFLSGTTVSETVFTPTFSLSEMNIYPTTLNALDDAGLTNLNGSAGPLVGRQDYTWALQWNITLAPGDSFLISKDKQITPTPGALALLGMGGVAVSRRRRR